MKKVIGVAVAASLVAGMAFADVAVTLNARVRSNMYHQQKYDNGNKKTYTFDLEGNSKHGGSGDMTDVLGFSAKTDYAGVVLEIAAQRNSSSTSVDKFYSDTNGTETAIYYKNSDGEYKSLSVLSGQATPFDFDGAYYGFMKFGGLKLTFGTFDSRFVNRYNVTAGEAGLLDSNDIAKYGTALLNGKLAGKKWGNFLKDANNASAVAGSKSVSVVADYTFDDVAGGKLLVKGGLLGSKYKTDEDSADDKKYQRAGYVGELDFENDSIKLQGLVKAPNEKQTVFGVFVEPKLMAELPLALGFSYGTDSDKDGKYNNSTGDNVTAMAFDARVGYLVNDQLKVSTVAKYETVNSKAADKSISALAVAGEVSYIVNDLATVFGDIGYYNYNLGGEDTFAANKYSIVKVRPGVVLNAGAGARVTAAFQFDSNSGDAVDSNSVVKTEWSIPVIFRVKL